MIIDNSDYIELISSIQNCEFEVLRDLEKDNEFGGDGEKYSFIAEGKVYCSFTNNDDLINGDYTIIKKSVQQFIENHKTECQLLFDELDKKLHNGHSWGYFDPLPPELEKYRVE